MPNQKHHSLLGPALDSGFSCSLLRLQRHLLLSSGNCPTKAAKAQLSHGGGAGWLGGCLLGLKGVMSLFWTNPVLALRDEANVLIDVASHSS